MLKGLRVFGKYGIVFAEAAMSVDRMRLSPSRSEGIKVSAPMKRGRFQRKLRLGKMIMMKHVGLKLWASLVMMLLAAVTADAAVYKCTDVAGNPTIQDRACGPEAVAHGAEAQSGTAAIAGHHLLWKVVGRRGIAYLVGSIHFGTPAMYPLPAEMTQAYQNSQELVVETDLTALDPAQMARIVAAKAMFADGMTLSKAITPKTWQDLERVMKRFGASAQTLEKQKPWFASMTLTSLALRSFGFSEELGIDNHFMKLAHDKKPIIGLETLQQQLDFLDGFSNAEQEAMLKETFDDIEKGRTFLDETVRAWRKGDARKIDSLMNEELRSGDQFSEHMYQVLIADRNTAMTEKLDKLLDHGGTYFVILGAAHFVGENGIVALLKSKGYQVEKR